MSYEEFVQRRGQGTIAAGIDKSVAFKIIGSLPRRYEANILFWSWVCTLSVPAFIVVSIFVHWLVGILLLVFVTPTIFKSTKDAAARFVLAHAERDKEFFDWLVAQNFLVFRESP